MCCGTYIIQVNAKMKSLRHREGDEKISEIQSSQFGLELQFGIEKKKTEE